MVRDIQRRIDKYKAKLTPEVITSRFTALGPSMITQETVKFAELETIETDTKAILDAEGVPTILVPSYLNVARQFYKIDNNFAGDTEVDEFTIVKAKWVTRGLTNDIIVSIAMLFGVTIT